MPSPGRRGKVAPMATASEPGGHDGSHGRRPRGSGGSDTDAPRRIVCLTEETTEILYLLGEEDRIVGISAWTVRPLRARDEKPVVSAFTSGNVEKIAALEPDLVVGYSDVQADLAATLIRRNLPVLILHQHDVAEILDAILLLGKLVGAEAKARALVDSYRARLDAVRRESERRGARPRIYFEEWPEPLLCGSGWVSELIQIAGGVDVFADRAGARKAEGRRVASEEVLAARPDVILASWCGKPFEEETLRAREGWEALPALRANRVAEIDSSIILQPGPGALTAGLDALVAAIHPVRE